jgi:hypothetical protein
LPPLCENVFASGNPPFNVQLEILDIFFGTYRVLIWTERSASLHMMNVKRTDLHSFTFSFHFLTSFGLRVGWFAVFVKQWLDHCRLLVLQYLRQRLLWSILVLVGLQCITTLGRCPGISLH